MHFRPSSLRLLTPSTSRQPLRNIHSATRHSNQATPDKPEPAANTKSASSEGDSSKIQDDVLGLPEPSANNEIKVLDMSSGKGQVSLDHLGPVVVNRDGTVGRVGNWGEMTDHERRATLELLRKRNMLRREALKGNGA